MIKIVQRIGDLLPQKSVTTAPQMQVRLRYSDNKKAVELLISWAHDRL